MVRKLAQKRKKPILDIKDFVSDLRDDRVIINLLITEQCNFTCYHCFYGCSPQSPNMFMSDEVLSAIEVQIDTLKSLGIYADINLIGGEPTINLKKFKHYLEWAVGLYKADMIAGVQMTTNGWWLKELRWVRRFMEVISSTIPNWMYGLEGGFTCRISNDEYHSEFHPKYLLNKDGHLLGSLIDTLWEPYAEYYDEPVFYKIDWYECWACGEDYDDIYTDGRCTKCNEGELEPVYSDAVESIPPNPADGHESSDWLYIERYNSGSSSVIPTSKSGIGTNDIGERIPGKCASGVLTYKPDGTLSDICCRGSNVPLGTVEDDPVLLLAMAKHYVSEIRPSCYTCKGDAKVWIEDKADESRKHVQGLVDQFYEDIEEFDYV